MIFPDEIRKCVGFVCKNGPDGQQRPVGTFFLVHWRTPDNWTWRYAVTAKHLIIGIKNRKTSRGTVVSVDGKVILRFNRTGGGLVEIETDPEKWRFHPTDNSVDIAVGVMIGIPPQSDFRSYPIRDASADRQLIRDVEIGVGDEVCVTGLFVNHTGVDRNIPIVRVGNIAAMPEQPIETALGPMEAYLIESRSIGGLSGSPVFVNPGLIRMIGGKLKTGTPNPPYPSIFHLLGLMHGHFDVEMMPTTLTREAINMGIAVVPPVWKILEVIDQPLEAEMRKKFDDERRKRGLPKMDLADEPGVTAEEFEDFLKQASRKKPDESDQGTKGT
jgi:hypothetical protein